MSGAGETWGVWGGMGEGERRRFRAFLESRGIRELPANPSSVLNEFYAAETNRGKQLQEAS